ncbi:hypothetical protein [Luteithermobacter gelatinilyticus]|uniref:hypothetical protein n=1 Tax=Luteithermobacter gelatinilyticus TaxID=2582913 RepID=UPI001105F7AF|nr:hypothetical protein [Luteithermobacter gelatinilyticus]
MDHVVTPHPSSLRKAGPETSAPQGQNSWIKTYRSILISGGLSALWIGACVTLFILSERNLDRMPLYEIAGLVSGAMLPLIVIWMVTIAFLRLNPVREEQAALSHGLEALLSPLDMAQRRIEIIVADLHKQIASVEAAGDIATSRIGDLESRFQEQISALFEATTTAESKAQGFQELLSREREALATLAADITEHVKELETLFSQLKFDSESITNLTRKNSEKVSNEMVFQKKTLDEKAAQIEERLNAIGDKLYQLSDRVDQQTTNTEDRLTTLITQLDDKRDALAESVDSLAGRTEEICQKLDDQAKTIQEITGRSVTDSDKLTALIREQAHELSAAAAHALAQTAEAGESFKIHAQDMGRIFAEVTGRSKDDIEEMSEALTSKADHIRQMITDFTQNLDHLVEQTSHKLSTQSESLQHSLAARISDAQEALEEQAEIIRQGLKKQGEEIRNILNENNDTLTRQMAEALQHLEQHSGKIHKTVVGNAEHLEQTLDHMAHHTSQFEDLSGRFRDQMRRSEQQLRTQQETLSHNITLVTEALEKALGALKERSSDLGSHGQQVVDSLIAQTEQLAHKMEEMRQKTASALHELQTAEDSMSDHLHAVEETAGRLSEDWHRSAEHIDAKCADTLERLNDLVARIKTLEQENHQVSDTAEGNIKRLADELMHASESIYLASASAIEAADETNKAIDQHNQNFQQLINAIQMSSKSIIADAENIEKRLGQRTSSGFAPLASRVMEQLQSAAIDIGRYLEEEETDELWKLYVNGDKNAFLRRLKKVADKKTVTRIAEKCKAEPDFRHHVQEYIETFEDLMSRVMGNSANAAFSVALISSDAGKVYLALAQALGRLS